MLGLGQQHIHDNVNLFQRGGYDPFTGAHLIDQSDARAGDHIEFYAELDLLVSVSICPTRPDRTRSGALGATRDRAIPFIRSGSTCSTLTSLHWGGRTVRANSQLVEQTSVLAPTHVPSWLGLAVRCSMQSRTC